MKNLKLRGVRIERDLANKLWEMGFAVIRGGSSGGGVRKRYVPDLVVMKAGKIAVLEVKYRSESDRVQLKIDRLYKLQDFARRAGGEAFIVVKFRGEEYRFVRLRDILQQLNDDREYVYLTKEEVNKLGLSFKEFIELFNASYAITEILREKSL